MTPPVCVWCLRPASDPIHHTHPFTGPRVEVRLTTNELDAAAREFVQLYETTYGAQLVTWCNCYRCVYYRDVKAALERLDGAVRVSRLSTVEG